MAHRIDALQPHHFVQVPTIPLTKTQHEKTTFKTLLENETLKVSKHAEQRLKERNIQINDQQWQLIAKKMHEAKQKGVTDSLVVMNHAALLVSTKNQTVVTAMNRDEAETRIFTNINGTILIND